MKRDAVESLEKIRKLCNDPATLERPIQNVVAQIEWICRHALPEVLADISPCGTVEARSLGKPTRDWTRPGYLSASGPS
jgi:hypothetical protein